MIKFKITKSNGKLITKFSVKNDHFNTMYDLFDRDFTRSVQFVHRQDFTNLLHDVIEKIDKINVIESILDDSKVYDFYLSHYE